MLNCTLLLMWSLDSSRVYREVCKYYNLTCRQVWNVRKLCLRVRWWYKLEACMMRLYGMEASLTQLSNHVNTHKLGNMFLFIVYNNKISYPVATHGQLS
jgi:hypothetical protein